MQKNKIYIFALALISIIVISCNNEKVYESTNAKKKKKFSITIGKFNKLVKSSDMDAKYAAAIRYFEKEDYTRALTLFEELVSVYRGTTKAEEIQYYYAYCHYNIGDYILAGYHFRNYSRVFQNGKHAEECAYMNAYCFYLNSPNYSLDQIDTKLAIKEFQKFVNLYPKSERVKECNNLLDELRGKLERKSYENSMLYYNTGNYKASAIAFDNHIKDFPDTKHREELNFLIIKSHYLLALNSIDSKKEERFKAAMDSYTKFAESFPKSDYLKQAEGIYNSSKKQIEKINNKQTS
ncbi:MAG: outer membrane protein assembly factor BamD [Bacteroidia bacterium]|nr:outer membrane protein assembly factor BamD [Bacteroidia bacterium]